MSGTCRKNTIAASTSGSISSELSFLCPTAARSASTPPFLHERRVVDVLLADYYLCFHQDDCKLIEVRHLEHSG